MDIPVPRKPVVFTPWFTKFMECFFAGVIVINVLFIFLQLLPRSVLLKMSGLFVSLLFQHSLQSPLYGTILRLVN